MAQWLPHVNVSLNILATILLLLGRWLIYRRQEQAHKTVMMATLATSALFLVSYLTYHWMVGHKEFPKDTSVAPLGARYTYYAILLTHVLLAATVPFLAGWAAYTGWRDKRVSHRKIVKWAWPIWLYVSVTGVIVYLMMYQIYVPPAA